MDKQSCIYAKINACFEANLESCFTPTLDILSAALSSQQFTATKLFGHKYTVSQCNEEFTGRKIAFYDGWRIQSSVAPQFPSPPCGFCQMK